MSDCVLCQADNGIALVTINRPEVLNALNPEVLRVLDQVLSALDRDPAVRVVILTGSGEKAFVAGADIASMRDMTPVEARAFSAAGQAVLQNLENMRPVVIAAINGFALGGGCELAMACDFIYASDKAKFGQPEINLGVVPGFGGTQRLPRLVGLGIAKELLATGRQVKAEECKSIGLVNHVTAPEELLSYCRELAAAIAANSASAIDLGKQCMNAGVEMDLVRALEYEANLFGVLFSTHDQKEGMTAFLEKRRANFL